eukprot:SAG31_NODE_498_length_14861_cov_3.405026_2_plen_158_part_00
MFVAVITTVFADVRSTEHPVGGMSYSEKPAAKKEAERERNAKLHAAWNPPVYFVAALGGRGPYEEAQHPGHNEYPMKTACDEKLVVEVVIHHLKSHQETRRGVIVDIDEDEHRYAVQLEVVEDVGEGDNALRQVWARRSNIHVPPELEKLVSVNWFR